MTIAKLTSLLEDATRTSYTVLNAELATVSSMSKAEVVELARGMGIVRALPTKGKAVEAIKGLVMGRKDAWERTEF